MNQPEENSTTEALHMAMQSAQVIAVTDVTETVDETITQTGEPTAPPVVGHERMRIHTLERARALPEVDADTETKMVELTADSVTVFKSEDGRNMEIVLAKPEDLIRHIAGNLMVSDGAGRVLAAQELQQD